MVTNAVAAERGCLAAGVTALARPGPTAYVLVLVVATWAVVAVLCGLFAAFQHGETAGTRTLFILSGLVSITLGVVISRTRKSACAPLRCSPACSP